MDGFALEQRCSNHEAREAVCRCPICRRSYCRECVTEHEERLVCAGCLRGARAESTGLRKRRRTLEIAMATGGLLLAWALFLGAAEGLITIAERSERMEWQAR